MTTFDEPDDHRGRRRATAFHEAGHAIVAHVTGATATALIGIDDISLVGGDGIDGRVGLHVQLELFDPGVDPKLLEAVLMMLLAGVAAEHRETGKWHWDGAADDLAFVREIPEWTGMQLDDVGLALTESSGAPVHASGPLWDRTRELIANEKVWSRIAALAQLLESRGALTRDELQAFLQSTELPR